MNLIEALKTLHNGAERIVRIRKEDERWHDLLIELRGGDYIKDFLDVNGTWQYSSDYKTPIDNWKPVYKQKFKEGEVVLRLQNEEIFMISSYNKDDNTYALTNFVHHIGVNGISGFEECELKNFDEAMKEKGLLK